MKKEHQVKPRIKYNKFQHQFYKEMHKSRKKAIVVKFIKNLSKQIIIILIAFFAVWGVMKISESRAAQMRDYEIANNCKYDYNDLCYTKSEKPWLFN